MAEPWAHLVPNDEEVFAQLLGAIDPRAARAFDPDGKPRVPASSGEPYPFPDGAYPSPASRWDVISRDPAGSLLAGIQRAGDIGMATAQTAGPPGALLGSIGQILKVGVPGPAWNAASEALKPIHAQEALSARQAQEGLARFMKRFDQPRNPSLTFDEGARSAAKAGGMVEQVPNAAVPPPPGSSGFVRPEADPERFASALREADAIRSGRFKMERHGQMADELGSATNQRINRDATIDETMQRWLGSVAQRTGTPPDQLARLPKGEFERFVANEPGLRMIMKQYGMTMDDVIGALGRRQYAVPPNAPFNANVMQQYEKGRSGPVPMTDMEKALRDAMHRRNRRGPGDIHGDDPFN